MDLLTVNLDILIDKFLIICVHNTLMNISKYSFQMYHLQKLVDLEDINLNKNNWGHLDIDLMDNLNRIFFHWLSLLCNIEEVMLDIQAHI